MLRWTPNIGLEGVSIAFFLLYLCLDFNDPLGVLGTVTLVNHFCDRNVRVEKFSHIVYELGIGAVVRLLIQLAARSSIGSPLFLGCFTASTPCEALQPAAC